MSSHGGALWVFHRGALGDSVLLWPLLRARCAAGEGVTLVSDSSKAKLAAANVPGVAAHDAEQRWLNNLWVDDAPVVPVAGVGEVVAFTSAPPAAAEYVWLTNLERMFPGARVRAHEGRPDAVFAREWSKRGGAASRSVNPRGPIVCHIGAGAEDKRWPMARFAEVGEALRAETGAPVVFIAGEVEAERMSDADRRMFEYCGGKFVGSLDRLSEVIEGAGVFIGNDSGPTHLAAQLGVETIALFGPTDPVRWGPVGPAVEIIAPPSPRPMSWLESGRVVEAVRRSRAAGQESG